jgi:hypothetical protein
VAAGEGQDEPNRAFGKAVTAKSRNHLVTQVSGVHLDRSAASDSEAESAYGMFNAVDSHGESIGRSPSACLVRRLAGSQLEPQVSVTQDADIRVERRPHRPRYPIVGPSKR